MGYLSEKYTSGYFLKKDADGKPTWQGVEGLNEFLQGGIRSTDKSILDKVNFEGKRVLEIGYGRGEALKYCAEHGARSVTGVDFSKDAHAIAVEFLKQHGIVADLHCEDALAFIKSCRQENRVVDIVLLLDVIEHIPRSELSLLLAELGPLLTPTALLIVNTPVFVVDNDVLAEGLDPRAIDSSDQCDMTRGMHCNRYTHTSLDNYLSPLGFAAISGHAFAFKLHITPELRGTRWAWINAFESGYPIMLDAVNTNDVFEYARPLSSPSNALNISKRPSGLLLARRVCWRVFGLSRRVLKKCKLRSVESGTASHSHVAPPQVERLIEIEAGPLRGGKLLLCLEGGASWNKEIREGTYDSVLYDVIKMNVAMNGAVIWDVGAHIGYHTLCFASLVGSTGKVVAFEPNPANRQRLVANVATNISLKPRIAVREHALGDLNSVLQFHVNENINDGRSSGSHLDSATPPEAQASYADFASIRVECRTGDDVIREKPELVPRLIKLDIEGAEAMCLFGCRDLLAKHKPHLLIEIHNILMMHYCMVMLTSLGYRVQVLAPSCAGVSRCFTYASPE